MATIHITDIESAINFWRERCPAHDGLQLAPQVNALAQVYGLLVHQGRVQVPVTDMSAQALAAWLDWYHTTPDTPCIAICSTSQGDAYCKGCGRSFDEVQQWPSMAAADKRSVWHRITMEGTAWRFTRYAERALQSGS